MYKLMTVRGRTSATIAVQPVYSEAGDRIAAGLAQNMTKSQLAQATAIS